MSCRQLTETFCRNGFKCDRESQFTITCGWPTEEVQNIALPVRGDCTSSHGHIWRIHNSCYQTSHYTRLSAAIPGNVYLTYRSRSSMYSCTCMITANYLFSQPISRRHVLITITYAVTSRLFVTIVNTTVTTQRLNVSQHYNRIKHNNNTTYAAYKHQSTQQTSMSMRPTQCSPLRKDDVSTSAPT